MTKIFNNIYKGKRVLVTGNTGFKGSWLTIWLKTLGAEVVGLADGIPTKPSNYIVSGLDKETKQYKIDVRNYKAVLNVLKSFNPDIVFHLAAQALVQESLIEPRLTFETNVLGTVNVLEALRNYGKNIPAVIITSDKCYRNLGWERGYRENDELGGYDPYSASKGCAELVCRSYANIYNLVISTARAGNVIGGGDWAQNRIIPDCVKAWSIGTVPLIRHPNATRPWQHVLEPLSGYLWLGVNLLKKPEKFKGQSYNFGPNTKKSRPVKKLLETFDKYWPEAKWKENKKEEKAEIEPKLLKLNCDKALSHLKWHTILSFEKTIEMTADWYLKYYQKKENMYEVSLNQIEQYIKVAQEQKIPWVR